MDTPTSIDFWFDPVCPFTWITSRWATEVSQTRGFTINWQPFSLAELNGREETANIKPDHVQGHRLGRIAVAVGQHHGTQTVGRYYTAVGERLHPGGRKDFDQIMEEALAEAGADPELIQAANDEQYDGALTGSTHKAIEYTGKGVGIPIIKVADRAFFGPVITPRPTGQQALELWDAYLLMTGTPGFFELKRGTQKTLEF